MLKKVKSQDVPKNEIREYLCETRTQVKTILNGKYKQLITPYVSNGCIVLDKMPIKYTTKRWESLFKVGDISRIPNFDWIKFTKAETHREQYIILVNHLDNL